MPFLKELRRRRVTQVAIAYGVVAWAITEVLATVLPALGLPEWTITFIIVCLLVGFPIAMVLAWIFDVGPGGIERTEPAAADTAVRNRYRTLFALLTLTAMAGLGYLLYVRGVNPSIAAGPRDSIAVLPFVNLSGDPSQEYFSDGVSEELLNLLVDVPGLKVAARTSSFAYKGQNVDVREVARELGVETVLEGSVRQADGRVRITAQLIDAATGFHLWSETYDAEMSDIFSVQDEISTAIVQALKIELAGHEEATAVAQHTQPPTDNVEAYQLYLQGRHFWKRRGEENVRRAIDLYQRALGLDPAFARAHAALASALVVLPGYAGSEPDEAYEQAVSAARQALALDPNLLGGTGLLGAAVGEAEIAYEMDPTSAIIAANLAIVELAMDHPDAAQRYADLALDLGLTKDQTGIERTLAIRRGDYQQALDSLRAEMTDAPPALIDEIAEWFAALEDPSLQPRVLAEMRAADLSPLRPIDLVIPYAQIGGADTSLEILIDAAQNGALHGDFDLGQLWTPEAEPIRRHARFPEFVRRVGLLDYWKQYGYPDACRPGDTKDSVVCS